jgi:tRNA A58 N-methylase Trm61
MRALSCCVLLALAATAPSAGEQAGAVLRPPDVIYVPTPPEVVARMLSVARVGPGDVVYDLGSGDGRIVISAVRDAGAARGVGIDIDPQRIKEANENARRAGVTDRVVFRNEDLFEADFGDATVIAIYLIPSLNLKLQPKLRALRPGTRIVSHNYDLGAAWPPDRTESVSGHQVFFWTVPSR